MIAQTETQNGRSAPPTPPSNPIVFPYRVAGKRTNLLNAIWILAIIPGFWTYVFARLGWEAGALWKEILYLLAILAVNGFGLYLAHMMVWKHTRYVLFGEQEIVVQWLVQRLRFKTADLQSIDIKTWTHQSKGRTYRHHGLNLVFNLGQTPYLLAQHDFAEPLIPLLASLCQQYDLPYTHERVRAAVPHGWFGNGSLAPFRSYFDGESDVNVKNIEDVLQWLLSCRYERDIHLFDKSDHWQHPQEFEQRREGDCEDHALWAWRKLVELGVDAEFVVGRTPPDSTGSVAHAWVTYTHNGQHYLLESVSKSRRRIIRLLHETHDTYFPHYSVNGRFQTFQYPHYVVQHRGQKALADIL